MKGKSIFTHGMIGEGIIGDPSVDTRHGPKTKSFGYQVLGFGSGGGPSAYSVQYLVVAGGAAGNNYYGGGGGAAGGMRIIASKLFEVEKCVTYPIQVGAGGPSAPVGLGPVPLWPAIQAQRAGEPSIFSTITSTGGGSGGKYDMGLGASGGSGGGAGSGTGLPLPANRGIGGSGNSPAIPAPLGGPQGYDGGKGNQGSGGDGGGHSAVGGDANPPAQQASSPGGGDGTATSISGICTTYAGGGGHGSAGIGLIPGCGGAGGGGDGGGDPAGVGQAGQANTGGGAGAAGGVAAQGFPTQPGGSGIVIIRRLTSSSCTTSGTDSTCGSDTIHKFTGDGTFVG